MTKKKREIILVLILLAAASAGFLINQAMHRQPAARVEITVDGHLVQTLDLNHRRESGSGELRRWRRIHRGHAEEYT